MNVNNYPISIIDNFFDYPDDIVNYADTLVFTPTDDGRWPGRRTEQMWDVNPELFDYISRRVHLIFNENDGKTTIWRQMNFQSVSPFSDDQYDCLNQGWIHIDNDALLGGIIFLNKYPKDDTGVTFYQKNLEWNMSVYEDNQIKMKHYNPETQVDYDEYKHAFERNNSKFTETITVKNVYNRLILFPACYPHSAQTYGKDQNRLNLVMFIEAQQSMTPLYRSIR
jgi:hypothetical protein